MKVTYWFLLCFLALLAPLQAQDVQSNVVPPPVERDSASSESEAERPPRGHLDAREIVPSATPVPVKRFMLFVVDVSGSMQSGALAKAIDAVVAMTDVDNDDYYIGLIAFDIQPTRWRWQEKKRWYAWAIMPSVPNLRRAYAWLRGHIGLNNGTAADPALRLALADPREELTIILITDGIFRHEDNPLQVLRDGQQSRQERGLSPATLMVIGIGEASQNRQHLQDLGREGEGGFYVQD